MRFNVETLHDSQGSPHRRGLISGFLWKLTRESLTMTQYQMAEALRVDVATIQGWETGRRPLTALRVADVARLRIRLIRHGAHPHLFDVLRDAVEADQVIEHATACGGRPSDARWHPLAATVHRRNLTNLITWPFTGVLPSQLDGYVPANASRRGPSALHPTLSAEERSRFFAHLLTVADSHRATEDALLRRQAIYLLAFDCTPSTAAWLIDEHRHALGRASSTDDVPSWVAVRSASVALARYGLQDPLLGFVETGLGNETQALANLNYWAYWVGEIGNTYTDDAFMRSDDPKASGGHRLLEHLIDRIGDSHEQVELYIHTLWQLLLIQPAVTARHRALRLRAQAEIEAMNTANLSRRARQQLSDVTYALRLS